MSLFLCFIRMLVSCSILPTNKILHSSDQVIPGVIQWFTVIDPQSWSLILLLALIDISFYRNISDFFNSWSVLINSLMKYTLSKFINNLWLNRQLDVFGRKYENGIITQTEC